MTDDKDSMYPSVEEWRALYDAAIEFKAINPWSWMKENNVFGVQDPVSKEIGYCCIMGELGEVLALAVYLGTEGLEGYLKIVKDEARPGDPDSLFIQNCHIVTYEDSRFTLPEDKNLMNALGYKLRGRHAWPVIRNYRPGFFPWFLDKAEACYMTSALQQAQEVSLRCKDSKSVLKPPKKGFYLVRVSKKGKKGLSWHDEWMQPAPVKYKSLPQISSDEIELRRIKKQASTSSQIWGIDFFYLPAPVKEADRPFFPYAIMIADSDTGFIHNVRISAHDQYRHDLIELLLSSIKNTGSIPLELLVRKEEAKVLLMPVTSHLGIKLSVEKSLGSIDQARRNFARFLKKEFK